MRPGRTLEQLAAGDGAETTCRVTPELVASFVTLSGDRNPIHRDAEFAASTRFGECIAPGMLSASLIAAVIGSELPGPGCVYLSQSLKFLRPVKLHDTLTARVVVTEILPDRQRVRLRTECLNGAGEPVLTGEAWVMPPAAAAQRRADPPPLTRAA